VYYKINEISSLSTFEYISLIGHYNKLTLDKKVDPRLLSRGYTKEALEQMKDKMGKLPSEIISLDVHFKSGIDNYSIEYFGYVMTLFDAYQKNGILPYSGSLSEQPNKIIEIFQVIDQLKFELEQKTREQQQRETTRNNRKKR
jgi:hypothetical protein